MKKLILISIVYLIVFLAFVYLTIVRNEVGWAILMVLDLTAYTATLNCELSRND